MERRHSVVVAIVGAGASGTLAAIQLLRRSDTAGMRVEIKLIDPAPLVGRGAAYGTRHPQHLLNIPASRLGAVAGDPGHFARWLGRAKQVEDPDAFVPRAWFGEYLEETLEDTVASSPSRLHRIQARVTEIQRRQVDSTVRLDRGERFRASHVILALGSPSGPNQLLPASLLDSSHFVGDPWAPHVLDRIASSAGNVLLLGTGLTMVDVALQVSRSDRTVYAISRRGLMPRSHASGRRAPVETPSLPEGPLSLAELRSIFAGRLRATARAGRCWQDAVDSLRPVTNELWARLSPNDQERFVTGPMRSWEVLRHRMPPQASERFSDLVRSGALQIGKGAIDSAVDVPDAIEVRLTDGSVHRVSAVVSCTGAVPVRAASGAVGDLVRDLEHEGTVAVHRLGMGVVTDNVGRACTAGGEVRPPIYVIGALRRGPLWETTAIPEILGQSDDAARHILAEAPVRRSSRRHEDLYGETLSTTGAAADQFNEGLGRLLRVQSGAFEAFQRSVELDPAFALGHAALSVMGQEFDLPVDVPGHMDLAESSALRATAREQSFVEAIRRRIDGSSSALVRHIDQHPRDVLAISVAVPTIAFSGAYELSSDAWPLLDRLAGAYKKDWWYDGLLAFARQEQDRFEDARRLAERSLALEPRGGTAAHALAHVFFETGDHGNGLRWIDTWIARAGRDATHLAHFSWHAALFELALDDTEAVLVRLQSQLRPHAVQGTRMMVDTASLLWRLLVEDDLLALDPRSLPEAAGKELWDPSTTFSAMHAVITWAVVGDLGQLHRLECLCRQSEAAPTVLLVAPLATALRLYLTRQYDAAANVLMSLLPNLVPLGGSAAQRSIVEDTAISALIRAGDGATATLLLQRRMARRPRPKDAVLRERALATLRPLAGTPATERSA